MRVAMIGTGYVGLVSGACFADFGHDVVCIDKDAGKIERLKTGEIPIFEPGLEGLVERNVREGRLSELKLYKKAVDLGHLMAQIEPGLLEEERKVAEV